MTGSIEEHGYFGSPKLFEVLLDDTSQAFKELSENVDSQYLRRSAVRAAFGYIEGTCAVLCNEVLLKHRRGAVRLTEKEIKVVENKETELIQRVKKSFSAYNRLHDASFVLDTTSSGFSSFRRAKQVRNNLTHPSRYIHIVISDSDVAAVAGAHLWIKGECMRLMNSVIESNLSRIPAEDRALVQDLLKKET